MKVNKMEDLPEVKKKSIMFIALIVIVVAIFSAGLIQLTITLLVIVFNLVVENWMWVLGGIGVLLLIRKIFFRRRSAVQDVRVVR